jgi:hypothetical protein
MAAAASGHAAGRTGEGAGRRVQPAGRRVVGAGACIALRAIASARRRQFWRGASADPRSSIELAASLVDDSAEALMTSVKERQHALLSAWQGDDAGTEEMRIALQQYRTFWNRIEDLSREA